MSKPMDDRYEGNFLDALDLPEGVEAKVTIESIADPLTEKDTAKKLIKNAIISFEKKQKRLILNKTNFKNLKAMFGGNPQNWIGKQIVIQRRYLDAAHAFGIENTLAIRVIPPIGTPILKSAANFMGSVTPYGNVPKPQQQPESPPPKEEQPATNNMPTELPQWLTGIEALSAPESCIEFRQQVLPDCPEPIRAEVEAALANKELSLGESQ